jgi:mannosyltransferase OCH1-like enzyme
MSSVDFKLEQRIVRLFIKLFGNTLKVFSYIHFFLFPSKRFYIAAFDLPLTSRGAGSTQIPLIIWQTNFTNQVTLPVYLNYRFNRLMAPQHEYRFMVTEEREAFIRKHFQPGVLEAYQQLQIGAAQADLWRLLVLQKFGGVYMDIDAHLVWPLHWTIRDEATELYLRIKTGEISNYFIASAPNNPRLQRLIDRIVQNIRERSSENVYNLTGPGVFNEVLSSEDVPTTYYLTTVNQGNFTNEFFQYIDKPQGKWTKEQRKVSVLKPPQ